MSELTGKVALVTGAGRGVGRGIALALGAAGAKVAFVDIDGDTARQAAATATARGAAAIGLRGNVRERDDIERMVETVVAEFGGLNILVNNAQACPVAPLLSLTDDGFALGWESGPLATVRLMCACHPHLRGDGVIINLSSSAASSITPEVGFYAAVKSATEALTRTAAVDWASDGIRAIGILPIALSAQTEAMLADPAARAALLGQIPLGRVGDPEQDIGRVVAFLCSAEASYITGTMIPVNGGTTYLR